MKASATSNIQNLVMNLLPIISFIFQMTKDARSMEAVVKVVYLPKVFIHVNVLKDMNWHLTIKHAAH